MNPANLIYDEPSEVYHGNDCVSVHDLEDLRPYPLLYHKKYIAKTVPPSPATDALIFGQFFHALALEGEVIAAERFIPAPEGIDRRTIAGKAAWAKFQLEATGRNVIEPEAYKLGYRMLESIREKPGVRELFTKGKPEVVARHKLKYFTLQCRCDWLNLEGEHGPVIVDVKTIDHIENFQSHFLKFGYYRTAAYYNMVLSAALEEPTLTPRYLFAVVEKNEPYQCALRCPDGQSLDIGKSEIMEDLKLLHKCHESKDWPGEPDQIGNIGLPEWKTRKGETP